MKRILSLLFCLIAFISIYGQTPAVQKIKGNFKFIGYVEVTDSSIVNDRLIFIEVGSLPTNVRKGVVVLYNDTLRQWNGASWLTIGRAIPETDPKYATDSSGLKKRIPYYPDYAQNFTKSARAIFNAVLTSKTWTGIAMSDDGKYRTASCNSDYLYVSSDYGANWTTKSVSGNWERVEMSGTGQYQAAILYTGANEGYVYVSSDYGQNWTQRGRLKFFEGLSVSKRGQFMAAAAYNDSIFVSSDYGVTWISKGQVRNWASVAINDFNYLLAGTDTYFYVSTDLGSNWTQKGVVAGGSWFSSSMSFDGKYQIIAQTSANAVYISSNYGSSFSSITPGELHYSGSTMSYSGKYIALCSSGGNISISTNYGLT